MFWPPNSYFIGTRTSAQAAAAGGTNIFNSVAFAALAGFLGIGILVHWRKFPRLMSCAWPALLMVAFAFLSAVWSDDPDLVVRRAAGIAVYTLFGIYLVARSSMEEFIALMVKVWAFAMAGSLFVTLFVPKLAIGENSTYASALRGAFTDKNTLGLSCALGIIFSAYAFRKRIGPRWLSGFTVVASLVMLKLAESKTPVVVIFAALYAGILGGAVRRRSSLGLLLGFTLAVLAIGVVAVVAADPGQVLAALGRDATLTNRVPIWNLAIGYIARRPWLGYGYEAFWRAGGVEANQIWALSYWHVPHAHNIWLELALSIGIVGCGLLAFLFVSAIFRALRVATAPHARHAAFALALTAGAFMENLSEYAFFRRGEILWLLFVTVFVYLGQQVIGRRATRPAPHDRPRVVLPPRRAYAAKPAPPAEMPA